MQIFKIINSIIDFYIRLKSDSNGKWTEKDIAGYGFILSTANNKKS